METIKGKFSNKEYNASKAVRVLNPSQAAAYWINGVAPCDCYPSRDYETGKPVIVYIFDREQCQDVYDKWCKYELK